MRRPRPYPHLPSMWVSWRGCWGTRKNNPLPKELMAFDDSYVLRVQQPGCRSKGTLFRWRVAFRHPSACVGEDLGSKAWWQSPSQRHPQASFIPVASLPACLASLGDLGMSLSPFSSSPSSSHPVPRGAGGIMTCPLVWGDPPLTLAGVAR